MITFLKQEMGRSPPEQGLSPQRKEGDKWPLPSTAASPESLSRPGLGFELNQLSGQHELLVFSFLKIILVFILLP